MTVLNCPYHTEAPEKVRSVPDVRPTGAHRGEALRSAVCAVLFLGLLALLVWGCADVYLHPEDHYPIRMVNAQPETQQPGDTAGQAGSQTLLQPVTLLAANDGSVGMAVPGADTVIARSGDHVLTNQEFIYFYWDCFYSLYDQLGSYLSSYLSFTTPFDQQQATDTQTWHQYLANMAVNTWYQTQRLCDEAGTNGYQLSADDEAHLNESMDALASYAGQAGFADGEGYLRQMFDPSSDLDSYRQYSYNSLLASGYAGSVYDKLYEDGFDPNAEVVYCVDVRHILIQPEDASSADSMAAAKAQAEALYEDWKKDPTEDHFSALATEHTQDPGSQSTGGLYEDVAPGRMVAAFNDWCFDESRQPGDHGIVETEYGYHIMYFVGNSDQVYSDGNASAAQEQYNLWLDDLFAGGSFESFIDSAVFTEKVD